MTRKNLCNPRHPWLSMIQTARNTSTAYLPRFQHWLRHYRKICTMFYLDFDEVTL